MRSTRKVFTVWMTGLPSSGKTTLSRLLVRRLRRQGRAADVIDGDLLRSGWCADLGFSRRDRERNIRRAAVLARLLNRAGLIAVVALVSPFRAARAEARSLIGPSRFIEAHIDCPIHVCRKRDVKGLYRLAGKGRIRRLTGVSDIYEAPLGPDWSTDTSLGTPPVCVKDLIAALERKRFL